MKKLLFAALIAILFYTRFVNLGWGFPYSMHPDERNMAVAIEQLSCPSLSSLATCLNPHFFAYGQLPLYLAYGGIQAAHFTTGRTGPPTLIEATLTLRIISAFSSIFLVFVLLKIVRLLYPNKKLSIVSCELFALIFLIFQPYAIQLAHFGTTESLLMLFYALIIYYSLKLLATSHYSLATVLLLGPFSGLALGTKTSSALFLGVPVLLFIAKIIGGKNFALAGRKTTDGIYYFCQMIIYIMTTLVFFILSSPHSFLNWNDFMSSMSYESSVGLGTSLPFYTRQFAGTIPIVFQFQKILPYALGWPTLIVGLLGFFLLPSKVGQLIYAYMRKVAVVGELPTRADSRAAGEHWRDGKQLTESSALLDILRFSLLLSFLPPSFFFAKWTRFISPSFPLFSIFSLLFLLQIFQNSKHQIWCIMKYIVLAMVIVPGFAYLSVYSSPDVRFAASEWIYKNIPANSKLLSETANVIDIPIPTNIYELHAPTYAVASFDFYDLDSSPQIQKDLSSALNLADYILIPSRRIFMNHPKDVYPILNDYYERLFSGQLGFKKVAEFSSYPKITVFDKALIEFPDEDAEETWTVFDHPVIRIYKRITNDKSQISNQSQITNSKTDFSDYKTVSYQLPTNHQSPTTNLHLLIADTPEKWEKGLMYVKNKGDIRELDGMIFLFPDSQLRSFWNKNTLSHLTLYWIQKGKIIGVSDLPSITESTVVTTISSPSPADTVIEIIR